MITQDQRAVFNAAYRIGAALGRKFEASDMTVELRQAAHLYATTYEGDFEYMAQMRDQANGGVMFFSDGQSKGILNCLMADAKRRLADRPAPKVGHHPACATRRAASLPCDCGADKPATAPKYAYLKDLPDGRYRVTLADGEHLAIRVNKAGPESKLVGHRIVSTRINGDEWMGCGSVAPDGGFGLWRSCRGELRDRVLDAVKVLDAAKTQDQWLVAGLAYAQEGSQCFICGRDLDTPESLTAGYGPVCADKHGLPWGAKAVPMSVRLAQASAATVEAPAEPQIDPETGVQESAEELLALAEATRPEPTPIRSYAQAKAEGRPRTYQEIFED
jgi:hypothetical protein